VYYAPPPEYQISLLKFADIATNSKYNKALGALRTHLQFQLFIVAFICEILFFVYSIKQRQKRS